MNTKIFNVVLLLIVVMFIGGCEYSKIPAGNVGVKVYLLGTSKGVDSEVLGPGRYWIGINEDLFLFPTYTVTYPWTKEPIEGSPNDESITFQTREGLSVNADVGISYSINKDKIVNVFQKYRKGIDEITDGPLRNAVRDALVRVGSTTSVESIYGIGKQQLLDDITKIVVEFCEPIGINIEKIYFIGDVRLPKQIIDAINSKIEATQRAQQRENELRETEAEAKKAEALAQGQANSLLITARAEAEAMKLKSEALTQNLLALEFANKWNGVLPVYSGGDNPIPFIQFDNLQTQ